MSGVTLKAMKTRKTMQRQLEKKKEKCFNRSVNALKAKCSHFGPSGTLPKILCSSLLHGLPLIKKEREALLARLELKSLNHLEVEAFGKKVTEEILRWMAEHAERSILPEHQEQLAQLGHLEANFAELHRRIADAHETVVPLYRRCSNYSHWRGADVVVTSDSRFTEKRATDLSLGSRMMMIATPGDADIVLITSNPYPLVWLMQELVRCCRDSDYLSAGNKQRFFGEVAASCRDVEGLHTGEFDERTVMLTMLERAMDLARDDSAAIRRITSEFCLFYQRIVDRDLSVE
jgi:hypothetical protein